MFKQKPVEPGEALRIDIGLSTLNLTLKVATQMLRAPHALNMVIISVKIRRQVTMLWAGHEFGTHGRTDGRKNNLATKCSPNFFKEHNNNIFRNVTDATDECVQITV